MDPQNRLHLSIVDINLKNRKLEDEDKIIDLSTSYYKGEEMQRDRLKELCQKAFNIHFIGEDSVNLGKEMKLVNTINKIEGIPYAFMIRC